MLNGKKLLSLLVIASFALQSCARGVSPTQGDFNFTDTAPDSGQMMDALCDDKGGDSDADGICNDDEVETDPNNADTDNNGIEDGDERTWFGKNKWWVIGSALVAAGGFFVARDKFKNGKYWFKSPSEAQLVDQTENVGNGLYFLPKSSNGQYKFISAKSKDKFFVQSTEKHLIIKNELEIEGNIVYNATEIAVKHGNKLLYCMHGGAIGTADQGSNRYDMSMYFKEDYLKKASHGGHKIDKYVTRAEFFNHCEQNTGIYVGTESKDGVDLFFAKGVPTAAFDNILPTNSSPSGYSSGLRVAYQFDQSLDVLANSTVNISNIKFFKHHPSYPNDSKYASTDYQVYGIVDANDSLNTATLDTSGTTTGLQVFQLMQQSNVLSNALVDVGEINANNIALEN